MKAGRYDLDLIKRRWREIAEGQGDWYPETIIHCLQAAAAIWAEPGSGKSFVQVFAAEAVDKFVKQNGHSATGRRS